MNILKLTDLTNKILNSKDFVYPEDFIRKVNKDTGVLKSTIECVCKSLYKINDTEIIGDIANLIITYTLINSFNGNGNFVTSSFAVKVDDALNTIFNDMDKLMITLNYGKKRYCGYTYEWKKRLKLIVLYAIGYHIKKQYLR